MITYVFFHSFDVFTIIQRKLQKSRKTLERVAVSKLLTGTVCIYIICLSSMEWGQIEFSKVDYSMYGEQFREFIENVYSLSLTLDGNKV